MNRKLHCANPFLAFKLERRCFVVRGQDTFTEGADTNLESHTSDSGQAWQPDTNAKFTIIAATDDLQRVDGGNQYARHQLDLGDDDMDVEITWKTLPTGTAPIGVTGRHAGTGSAGNNNYIAYWVNQASNGLQLYKNIAGVATQLGASVSQAPVAGDILKLEIRTAAKKVFVNNVEKISNADDNLAGNNYAGLFGDATSDAVGRVDDWKSYDTTVAGAAFTPRIMFM